MVQFGVHGDPAVSAKWKTATIKDDPVIQPNERGAISFAMAGPNTRTTQLFINFKHNKPLNAMGFAPFAKVIQGMDVVDQLRVDDIIQKVRLEAKSKYVTPQEKSIQ